MSLPIPSRTSNWSPRSICCTASSARKRLRRRRRLRRPRTKRRAMDPSPTLRRFPSRRNPTEGGVMAGDMIVRIDATQVKGLTLKEAVDKMRGPAKTHVAITVERGDLKTTKVFDIVREIIHVQPVRARTEGGDLGYIRITQFNEQT